MVIELQNPALAAPLFAGWQETMILSCLQRVMGRILVTEGEKPLSALAAVGCFAFLAGAPDDKLLRAIPEGCTILVPQDERWAERIEACLPNAKRVLRYAMKKDTRFNPDALRKLVARLPAGYRLKRIDGELYDLCLQTPFSVDFVSSFESKEKYLALGRGVVVLRDDGIVSGASSYSRYREGIEIEVDTAREERRRGLAAAACASLILGCLAQGLYPSWDAQNLSSVALAEKLGYAFSHAYPAYELPGPAQGGA